MPKTTALFKCGECGKEYPKWQGRCNSCGSFNKIEEVETETTVLPPSFTGNNKAVRFAKLGDINTHGETRRTTHIKELDRVLGGGLVKGSLVLIAGEPGIGKSTLMLQLCGWLANDMKVAYLSGEESGSQVKLRANRLKIGGENLMFAAETDCGSVISSLLQDKDNLPDVLVVDSIQTMARSDVASSAGSVTQVRECAALLMKFAKTYGVAVLIVGHVNKDGSFAGPKVLEHIVDTVLSFEGDKEHNYRILRAQKNRFGATNEIGVFEMRSDGLREVANPSELMLSGRPLGVAGISVVCALEGNRTILAEVQALVAKSAYGGNPRRVSAGFDYNRLCLIIAVLEKRTGFLFSACDVYVNIIGGLTVDEPAADLAVALALFSGLCDKPLDEHLAVFGELGLGGELRSVSRTDERLNEAMRLGFTKAVMPHTTGFKKPKGLEVNEVKSLEEAIRHLTSSS
ncbi:MAG: DNA repair protein RadA [Oscillospiraceae bacterium]|jgi:DNA repair protein RadA/Sms|nr:DNA repair protein RadA [Oscillospiraceae bacterium]